MNAILFTGTPNAVIDRVYDFVKTISKDKDICEFYVGRTNNLNATSSRHRCEAIVPIYKTDSIRYAASVENTLIQYFHSHHKCNNDACHSGGGWSGEYVNYVYVALWFENN